MIFIKEDKQFTNKEELEYPTEDDFVDVKILNNNTRLLSEKKADISDIEESLQGVAKERSEYSIEDKVKELDKKIQRLEDRESKKNWANLPNLKINRTSKILTEKKENVILEVTGSGNLVMAIGWFQTYDNKFNMKVTLDDEIIYNVDVDTAETGNNTQIGILNNTISTNNRTYVNGKGYQYIFKELFLCDDEKNFFSLDFYYGKLRNLSSELIQVKSKDYYFSTHKMNLPATVLTKEPIKFNKNFKVTVTPISNNARELKVQFQMYCIYNLD